MTIENHAIRFEPTNWLAWLIVVSAILLGGPVLIALGYFVDWLAR